MCIIAAMKPHEIQEKLGLTRVRDRNWYVQPCCATTGDGLYEGLTWLTANNKPWRARAGTEEGANYPDVLLADKRVADTLPWCARADLADWEGVVR